MKPPLQLACNLPVHTPSPSLFRLFTLSLHKTPNSKLSLKPPTHLPLFGCKPQFGCRRLHLLTLCSFNSSVKSNDSKLVTETSPMQQNDLENQLNFVEITNPNVPRFVSSWTSKFSLSDQAFFLLTFIACTTSAAFVSFVVTAVPTLPGFLSLLVVVWKCLQNAVVQEFAMGRAANSLAKLADTAREELPSTMAAIRLSGMEISDLTLELSDLSQEISEGVSKSAQVVQAAEVGIKQIGALARQQTVSIIEERASLPVISLQPVVSGAAKKTSRAVGYATRTLMNMISGGEFDSDSKYNDRVDRLEN